MEKAEIIKQWIDDQKPVNPEALGWKENEDGLTYKLDDFELSPTIKDCIFKKDELLFCGRITIQGELRILMKMLNINNNE